MSNRNPMKAQGMAVVLWNPTNEDFEMQYAGRSFTLFAGEKEEVNEACANHLLNAFGQRGLTFLKYGDIEDEVGAKAKERNVEFKKRQVQIYNQTNEQRKLTRLGYLSASDKIKQYALELGIELIEPYSLKDEEKAAISHSTKENADLRAKLEKQDGEMAELKAMMKQFMSKNKPEPEVSGVDFPGVIPEQVEQQDKPDRPKLGPNWRNGRRS